jgi:FG-GAP repeat
MPLRLARRVVGDFHALSPTTTFLKTQHETRDLGVRLSPLGFTNKDVLLETKEMMAGEESNIPTEGPLSDDDVIDSEFQQVDLDSKIEANADTVFKLEGLFKDVQKDAGKNKAPKRRSLVLTIFGFFGVVLLIGLVAMIRSGKKSGGTKKVVDNAGKKTKDDSFDSRDSSGNYKACTTTLSCPSFKNGTSLVWSKLDGDIVGDSAQSYSGFATALSCDGTRLAISAPQSNSDAGHVRIYTWDVLLKEWLVTGQDITGAKEFDRMGDALALSAEGTRLAIGSQYNDNGGEDAGHVQVFDYVNNTWIQVGNDIQGENEGDRSGISVALSADGSRLAVGAILNNGTGSGAGHVRIYELEESGNASTWKQLGKDIDGEQRGDQSGRSVSLSGDGKRVAIGGHTNDADGEENAGHVRVFEFGDETNSWTQVGPDLDGESGEFFGRAVSLSHDGSRVAVGAPGDSNSFTGETRVYDLIKSKWVQVGFKLDGGGYSVAMTPNGDRVVTGSFEGFHNGYRSGLTVVYDFNGTAWVQVGDDLHGDMGDLSGTSVAISADGNRIVSSAPGARVDGFQSFGRVRVFDMC